MVMIEVYLAISLPIAAVVRGNPEFFNSILADCVESRTERIPALHVMQ